MKSFVSIIFIFILAIGTCQQSEKLFEQARSLYNQKDFEAADSIVDKMLIKEPQNSVLWNFKGSVHFNTKDYGTALWCFEKAQKFNPGNDDAYRNAEICNDLLQLPVYQSILSPFERNLLIVGSNNWAYSGLLSVLILSFLIFISIKRARVKSVSGIILFVLFTLLIVVFFSFSFYSKFLIQNENSGVVLVSTVPVYLDINSNDPQFNIVEGSTFKVLEKKGDRLKIKLDEGQQVWIKSEGVGLL